MDVSIHHRGTVDLLCLSESRGYQEFPPFDTMWLSQSDHLCNRLILLADSSIRAEVGLSSL